MLVMKKAKKALRACRAMENIIAMATVAAVNYHPLGHDPEAKAAVLAMRRIRTSSREVLASLHRTKAMTKHSAAVVAVRREEFTRGFWQALVEAERELEAKTVVVGGVSHSMLLPPAAVAHRVLTHSAEQDDSSDVRRLIRLIL